MRPPFEARHPDYAARVRKSFSRQTAMASLGITLADLGPGWVDLALVRDPRFTQQHGFVHAGVMATALDSACGYAAFSLMPADAAVLTVEYKVNLMSRADEDEYLVRGWVLKAGRTLAVCQGEAVGESSAKTIAVMTATIMTLVGADIEA